MHHRQRQRHGAVELRAVFAAGIGEVVRAVGVLRVGVGEGLLIGFGQHHGHQVVRALGKLRCGHVLDALLLDTHVDDIGRVVRQRQVARRLHAQQRHNQQHGNLVLEQVLDYAHGTSPCSTGQPGCTSGPLTDASL